MIGQFNIYCRQCKTVPIIQMIIDGDKLMIASICLCGKKSQQSLDQFMDGIKKKNNQIYKCCVCNGKDKIEFCVQCSKWFCQNCRKTHNELVSQDFSVIDCFESGSNNYTNKHFFINEQIYLVQYCSNHSKIVANTICKHCSKFFCKYCPKEHKNSNLSFFKKFFLQMKETENQKPEDKLRNIMNSLNSYLKQQKIKDQETKESIEEHIQKIELINKDLVYISNLVIKDYLQMKKLHIINTNIVHNYILMTSYSNENNIIKEDINYPKEVINKCILIPLKQVKKLNIKKKIKGEIKCIVELDLFLFLIGLGNLILVLDIKNEIIKELKSTEINEINCICITKVDSIRYLVYGGNSKKIIVNTIEKESLSINPYCKFSQNASCTKILINWNNGQIASVYNNLVFSVWDCHKKELVMTINLLKTSHTINSSLNFGLVCIENKYCVFGIENVIYVKQLTGFGSSLFDLSKYISSGYFTCFSFINNDTIASGSSEGAIHLWSINSLSYQEVKIHKSKILNIVRIHSLSIILSGDANLHFVIWKEDFTILRQFNLNYNITNFVISEKLGLLSYCHTNDGFVIKSLPLVNDDN